MAKHKRKTKFKLPKLPKYTWIALAAIVLMGIIVMTSVPGGALAKYSVPAITASKPVCIIATVCPKGYTCVADQKTYNQIIYESINGTCTGNQIESNKYNAFLSLCGLADWPLTCGGRQPNGQQDTMTSATYFNSLCCLGSLR